MPRRRDIIGVLDATGDNFNTGAISVTDTVTAIPSTQLTNRKSIAIRNNSDSVTVYIGDGEVTTSTGYPLLPKEQLSFDIGSGTGFSGVCESGLTADVRYIEIDNG